MNIFGIIIVVFLVLALFGGLPAVGWYHGGTWGGGYGTPSLITIILVLVLLRILGII